ncbi:MAG: two-component regulator propeller domain-containing protein [Rubrivivax sp.]|nr:two-component regulator propeller domain-containing protein [Rubrivivax sp.]
MARFLLLLVLACAAGLVAGPAVAQRDPLAEPRLASVGDARSINDGVVTALAQDEAGLIWVGTTVGLVRHDGYQLRPVPVGGPQTGTRGASFVRTLLAAPGGVLWVGLEGEGLARLDIAAQRWTWYHADPATPGALANGSVRALALDHDGVLWVGTIGGGLHSLAPGAMHFEHHRRSAGGLPDDRVQSLWVDRRGDLWVGTWNGLARRARGGSTFTPVLSDDGAAESLAGRTVSMLGETPDGRLWVGTRQGDLLRVDTAQMATEWVDRAADTPGAADSAVLSMAVYDEREVWIGRESGIDLRAADGRLVRHLGRDLRKPWSIGGHNVVALLRDTSGGLWAGSYGGGLQRYSASPGLWVRRGEGGDDSVLAEADVRSLAQLSNGEIWAGTNERGVAVLDAQLRLIGEIRPHGPGARAFAGGLVGAIAQTPDGRVWVGADTGIYEFSMQRQLLGQHRAGQGRARRMLATRDGVLWVGTQDGVYRRDPARGRFERALLADGGALTGNVNALAEGADGSVWVGGNSGLYHAAAGQTALQAVASPPGHGLLKTLVLGLLVDRRQVLWVDTGAGLHRLTAWDGRQARFAAVAAAQVPAQRSVGANLLDDEQGRIWTHQIVYDPHDGSRHELSSADGVDIGTGWYRSYLRLADGRLLYGGSVGLLVVEPERFKPWSYLPPVVVSELRIDGERVPPGVLAGGLTLTPRQRSFSVEFAALDFGQADLNRYRYRLRGFDAGWVETGADFRVASYGNLPPGNYALQVQGSNRLGAWSPREINFRVTVQPAWWQTWWARTLGLLLAAALVLAVVQLRTGMLRRQQGVLERRVRERTAALEVLSLQLQEKSRALEASSLTDPLTGMHNRRYLAQNIEADVAVAVRRHEQQLRAGGPLPEDADLVFFLVDLDHFKQVNDLHGHAAGDAVLVQMRERLQQAFRQGDHLVRWGGEEFLVVARGTSRGRAAELAGRACAVVADTPFVLDDGTRLHRSCSVGFVAFPPAPALPAALDWAAAVDLADAALYTVKRSGRNGWLGLVSAQAESAAALRAAAARPLAEWRASGALQVVHSVGLDLDAPPAKG